MVTGHCKHGEFSLETGCPECSAAFLRNGYYKVEGKTAAPKTELPIVKVRYYTGGAYDELSNREYTYRSAMPLAVGDVVMVPVRDTTTKAQVSAVDVPESEVAAFKDKLKIIPADLKTVLEEAGATVTEVVLKPTLFPDPNAWKTGEEEVRTVEPEMKPIVALVPINPETDTAVLALYAEGVKLRDYAVNRVILVNADLTPATDDLVLIAKLLKAIKAKEAEYTTPLKTLLDKARDAFKAFNAPLEEAKTLNRDKVDAYNTEVNRRRAEVAQLEADAIDLARRQEALTGEHTVNLAPVAAPEAAPAKVITSQGSSGYSDHWIWEEVDFKLVPDEFKMLDAAKIGKVVRAGLHTIPGLKIENKPVLVINTR